MLGGFSFSDLKSEHAGRTFSERVSGSGGSLTSCAKFLFSKNVVNSLLQGGRYALIPPKKKDLSLIKSNKYWGIILSLRFLESRLKSAAPRPNEILVGGELASSGVS
jgi:hypothetical protein